MGLTKHGVYLYKLTSMGWLNRYLVAESDGLTVIDTGIPRSAGSIISSAKEIGLPIRRIALTHAHTDHRLVRTLNELSHDINDKCEDRISIGHGRGSTCGGEDLPVRRHKPGRHFRAADVDTDRETHIPSLGPRIRQQRYWDHQRAGSADEALRMLSRIAMVRMWGHDPIGGPLHHGRGHRHEIA